MSAQSEGALVQAVRNYLDVQHEFGYPVPVELARLTAWVPPEER